MSRARPTRSEIGAVARRQFGHDTLLPGQEEAVAAVLEGRDVLIVSPTGSGKSLTYQLAGVLLGGCTVVVSPLLALQRDQVRSLADLDGAPEGARISSAESESQRKAAVQAARDGEVQYLFLAPEQLANSDVVADLASLRPPIVAVDEAHCVSSWGHDFRPDYGRLGDLVERLGSPRVLAMTATAAPPVRADIVERLRMQRPVEIVTGFARDNIALEVARCADEADQRDRVLETVAAAEGAGIVYCRTRRHTEEYAAALDAEGLRTATYHAGMAKKARREAHEAFLGGHADVMVATSAFGMGIDKPDVRYVVHAQVPESVDTYYQEVGRAGRDGAPARGVLLFRPEDLALARFFASGVPKRGDVVTVARALADAGTRDRDEARTRTGLGPRRLGRIVNLLDEVSVDRITQDHVEDVVTAVLERAEAHRALERSRVEMVRAYAETDRCRAGFILGYFGDTSAGPCGQCDNCRAAGSDAATTSLPEVSRAGVAPHDLVRHPEFGTGTVTEVAEDRLTVLFDDVGYRQLSVDVVLAEGLLEPVASRENRPAG